MIAKSKHTKKIQAHQAKQSFRFQGLEWRPPVSCFVYPKPTHRPSRIIAISNPAGLLQNPTALEDSFETNCQLQCDRSLLHVLLLKCQAHLIPLTRAIAIARLVWLCISNICSKPVSSANLANCYQANSIPSFFVLSCFFLGFRFLIVGNFSLVTSLLIPCLPLASARPSDRKPLWPCQFLGWNLLNIAGPHSPFNCGCHLRLTPVQRVYQAIRLSLRLC